MPVPEYLGCLLDGSGTSVGTCFQVSDGVLVTAAHVLENLGADTTNATVLVRPLHPTGAASVALVRRVDATHDLAVLTTPNPLHGNVPVLVASDDQRLDQPVHITGAADVPLAEHRHEYLDAPGTWAGGTVLRGAGTALGRLRCQDVMRGMSGAPVRRAGDDAVVGVVTGRYNSADGWLRDSVWVARTEDLESLLAGLTTVSCTRVGLAPGGAELARWTVDLLSAVDGALTATREPDGLSRTVHELVAEVTADASDATAFRDRLRRNGLEPSVLLTWLPQHARAITQWSRDDDGRCAVLLAQLRERLAVAVEDGRLPATATNAQHIASALRGMPQRVDYADRLTDLVPIARTTSREPVLITSLRLTGEPSHPDGLRPEAAQEKAMTLDTRQQLLSHVARHICGLKRADRYLTGRDEVIAKLCSVITNSSDQPIAWVSGRPGVGSSEVAVHVAHRLATHYETVLYVDMHAQPGARRSTRTVARMLLEALGESITSDLSEAEVLHDRLRQALSSTRSLLVLDNARDAGHVAPLVRDGGAAAVIVTSRQRVQTFTGPDLAAHLPTLSRSDSIALLEKFRVDSHPDDNQHLEHIAGLCDDLPLALRLVGARLTTRPEVAVSKWAQLLTHEHTRLNFLSDEDRAVRSAIMLGYHDMDPTAQQATRYLSAVPGAVATEPELAYGLAADEAVTSLAMHRVVDASMAECESVHGSYRSQPLAFRLPELIRLVAAERLAAEETSEAQLEFHRRSARYLANRMTEIVDASDAADLALEVDPTRAHAALDLAVSQSWWDISADLGRDLRVVYRDNWDWPALAKTTEALITTNLATEQPDKAVLAASDVADLFDSTKAHRREALSWARRAERIAAEHNLSQERVGTCLLIADIATKLAEYKTAYGAMITARELLELHGLADESLAVLINLAKLAQHSPDVVDGPRDASWWANQAITIADRVGTPEARASAHFEMARVASRDDERDLAIDHYRVASACFVSVRQTGNAAVAFQNIAHLLSDDPHGAHAAWTEAVRLWRQCPSEQARLADALVMLARIQYELGMSEDADRSLTDAYEICPASDHPELHHEITVRQATLRRLSGAEYDPPPTPPASADNFITEVVRTLTEPTASAPEGEALLTHILRLPTIHMVAGYEFWIHDSLLRPASPRPELGPSQR